MQANSTIKKIEVGPWVQILDGGEYHGSYGAVTALSYGSPGIDYYIALVDDQHSSQKVVVTVPYAQKTPVLIDA
jgi:hypothetical protein